MTEAKPKVPFPYEDDHYLSTPATSPRSHSGGDDEAVVKQVQEALEVEQSGTYDEATREAVIAFQTKRKIEPTGVVDAATWKKLLG
jgi:peptidoglycan hydrolase-like protein with peptidoglycan-binding domain